MTTRARRRNRLVIPGLIVAALWVAGFGLPYLSGHAGPTDRFEYRLLDLRHRLIGPQKPAGDVVIVAIDDRTLGQSDVSGRALLGRVIGNIAASRAGTLAVDILLADGGDTDTDAALAQALGALPSVIAAAASLGAEGASADTIIQPQPSFREAARTGLVNISTDTGGTPRYVPLLIPTGAGTFPTLPLVAAMTFTGDTPVVETDRLRLGDRAVPLDLGQSMPLRHLGPMGTVPTYSASELLTGPLPDALGGKLVVLGYTASAMGDRFATPFGDTTPGVEIIATAISQLAGGPVLRRDARTRRWDVIHAAGLTLLCVLAALSLPLSRGLPVALALVGLSMTGVVIAFAFGLWMSAALPLVAALPPLTVAGIVRYSRERSLALQTERAAASLRRFQSPALARRLENDPDWLATPEEQHLVIFFVDLTGFTGLSQRLGPAGTQELLRAFHGLTNETVGAQGGDVLNYMGDGALAVFGLDRSDRDRAADTALAAAFALVRALAGLRIDALPEGLPGCRIGLHAGLATLSRLGADTHQQVTVTGDSVNLASRLMEVAKSEHATIVATRDFADALSKPPSPTHESRVPIRGRAGEVEILAWT
ncbi:CHASE2 domain-containing protein [Pukyongiella litopenaei]|uniref:Adenylate/guanylate cyclase domain-containing protein n=1 Tax=Pukyongiella litopenaei TaxID=2605946 RepID=A0A2S0MMJ9_9RHOB|nr:adenylate/guanylate cyclase domain-containing protein [Pukyongiella litopenaei]AVO37099.1 adenylate/guanylate cyclase domain-containing protein [Pukyongiella litopenaei]